MFHWLGFGAFTASNNPGALPSWGTKISMLSGQKNNCLKKILYVLKTTGRKREKEKVKEMENKEKGLRWSNKKKMKMLLLYFEKKFKIYSPKKWYKVY